MGTMLVREYVLYTHAHTKKERYIYIYIYASDFISGRPNSESAFSLLHRDMQFTYLLCYTVRIGRQCSLELEQTLE